MGSSVDQKKNNRLSHFTLIFHTHTRTSHIHTYIQSCLKPDSRTGTELTKTPKICENGRQVCGVPTEMEANAAVLRGWKKSCGIPAEMKIHTFYHNIATAAPPASKKIREHMDFGC